MDKKTIDQYNQNAKEYAKKHSQLIPSRLYDLTKTFFYKNKSTLDLGCGIGRDTNWLNENSYPSIGYDASGEMLNIAKNNYPNLTFKNFALPLNERNEKFHNIFCSAVLMHIPRETLVSTIISILNVLEDKGRLIISFRERQNDDDERLFESYRPGQIAQLFESLGSKVLLIDQDGIWNNLVIEKYDLTKKEGIKQIQEIISHDKKTATYKFALLRALCEIAQYESHTVCWYRDGDMVLIPLKRIAIRWVYYYWPLVKNNSKQTTNSQLAFQDLILEIPHKLSDISILKDEIESDYKKYHKLIKKIANTIKVGPVKYSGTEKSPVFQFMSGLDASVYPEMKESEFGMIAVPITIWRDINLFSNWIEDSLCMQWAELSERINKDKKFALYFDLITKSVQEDERSTYLVRKLMKGRDVKCVWSNTTIPDYQVDHMIPWTLWKNNDLWNLLPSKDSINMKKSNKLPSIKLIEKRFNNILSYWELYLEHFPELFENQIQRSLGINSSDALSKIGLEALQHTITRVQINRSGVFWEYF